MSETNGRWAAFKNRPPAEMDVDLDGGVEVVVIGLGRVAKSELVSSCTAKSGKVNGELVEAKLLARCAHWRDTREPMQPDPRDWDIASSDAGPLLSACQKVCGFDPDELEAMVKKSDSATLTDSPAD